MGTSVSLVSWLAAWVALGTPAPSIPPGPALSAEACRSQASAIGTELEATAQPPLDLVRVPDDVQLVGRADLPLRDDQDSLLGPSITLTPNRILAGGEVVASFSALAGELRQIAQRASILHGDAGATDRRILFAIDAATPWQRVVKAVTTAARAGYGAPVFVFAHPQPSKPSPRSPIDDALRALNRLHTPGERHRAIQALTARVVANCPSLQKSMAVAQDVEPDLKAVTMARAIAPGLIGCGCHANLPAVHALILDSLGSQSQRVLAFDPSTKPARLVLPGRTPWSEASKHLGPTLRNAKLIAR